MSEPNGSTLMDYERKGTTTEVTFRVTGAPDTRGPMGPRVTIRPEELRVRLDGGEDGTIRHIGIKGMTVRADGEITTYRENGWGFYSFRTDPLPPDWIVNIIDREGLRWPDGVRA